MLVLFAREPLMYNLTFNQKRPNNLYQIEEFQKFMGHPTLSLDTNADDTYMNIHLSKQCLKVSSTFVTLLKAVNE